MTAFEVPSDLMWDPGGLCFWFVYLRFLANLFLVGEV